MAQLLSNLPVGAKVKFGSIYNQPIVWLVAAKNHAGYPSGAITLLTERIIKIMAVDAKEPSNSNRDRKYYGNNRHIHSNILQWLNSQAGAGQWYQAQHAADAPPSSANVWNNHNPYDQQAGFLNAFSANEREAILETTLTVVKSTTDGGGSETFKSKVFLLSTTEVGLANESGIAEGSRLAMFTTDNGSRLCYPTAAAVSNSTYTDFSLNTGQPWYWWLRTPYASYAHSVRIVHSGGYLNNDHAYNGNRGLRPALNLPSSISVSDTTDADGCYTIIWNTPPTPPTVLNVPDEIFGGKTAVISWNAGSDVDGNLAGYELERSIDGGDYSQIYKGAALTYTDTITYGWNTVQYRVRSYDTNDEYSSYLTGALKTVINNRVPVISGSDGNLGVKTADFVQTYTVTDPDESAWYVGQHTYDQAPNAANVNNNTPYDTRPGFLYHFSTEEKNAILSTPLRVVKPSVDGGGYEDITRKVFLPSRTEVGLGDEGGTAEGTAWGFYTSNAARIAYLTAQAFNNTLSSSKPSAIGNAWYWWLRTPNAGHSYGARFVGADGALSYYGAFRGNVGVRPALNLLSSLLVSDTTDSDGCYTFVWNTPQMAQLLSNLPVGAKVKFGKHQVNTETAMPIIWTIVAKNHPGYPANAITLHAEKIIDLRCFDAREPNNTNSERKSYGNNRYSVSNIDQWLNKDSAAGATVTVVEKIDGVVHRTYPVVLGATNTFDITGVTWLRLLNGSHTLTITATDNHGDVATRTYTFTKNVTSFSIEPSIPFEASVMPTRISLSVSRSIPGGSIFEVLVCNNANDDSPTWEDATSAVVGNLVHVFTNTTKTAATWAVGIKVNVDRGTGSGACYVSGIGGNFE